MNPGLLCFLGYLIGSTPFSFLVARLFGVRDVRTVGSGNVGATNVMRSAGKVPGVIALVLDGLKGAVTVLVARSLSTDERWICAAGLCAVIGHLFPIWLGFRGGKGVATGAGLFIPLAPAALGVALGTFVVVLGLFRYVSLASIVATVALPLSAFFMGFSTTVVTTAAVAACMLVAKHHQNIARLAKGVEPKLGAKR